jgi:hypothetical protein
VIVGTRAKLNIRLAFAIGFGSWLLPMLGRAISGVNGVNGAKLIHDLLWSLTFYSLTLPTIAFAYRRLMARGLALVTACALSIVAVIPVIASVYLLDWFITKGSPSLSWMPHGREVTLQVVLVTALTDMTWLCLLLSAVVFLPAFVRAHSERTRELLVLQRDAAILRVRAHLEPHFVLNSLNAVASLVEEDPTQARELLAALGDLFRRASSFQATHRVVDEIDWLRRYVMIHEVRYADALHTSWRIDDACLDLEIPALILQPLVENAVKHGALRGGGNISVSAHAEQGVLSLAVEDDGPGPSEPRRGGEGLSIVERRLALESLSPSVFELVREGERTVARIRIPARPGVAHA